MPRDARRREAAAFDKEKPDFWSSAKSGDYLSLSDAEAFSAGLAAGGGSAQDYRIGDIRDFELLGPEIGRTGYARTRDRGAARSRPVARDGIAARENYRFIELLRDGSGPLYLALVSAPDRFELRLYFIPAGLEPGTRDELLDRGDTWLFLPPADPEDFLASELEYAPYPDVPEIEEQGRDGGPGRSRKLVFSRLGPGCLYGESLDTRSPVIIAEYAIAEYAADTADGEPAPANDLLLVLEEGWMRSDGSEPEEGGYVTIMLGKALRPNDVEHYPS